MGRIKDWWAEQPDTSIDDFECWQAEAKKDPNFEQWLNNLESESDGQVLEQSSTRPRQ